MSAKIDELQRKIEQLEARKKALLAREKDQERKQRTQRLIRTGAVYEKYFGEASPDTAQALCEILFAKPELEQEIKEFVVAAAAVGQKEE